MSALQAVLNSSHHLRHAVALHDEFHYNVLSLLFNAADCVTPAAKNAGVFVVDACLFFANYYNYRVVKHFITPVFGAVVFEEADQIFQNFGKWVPHFMVMWAARNH